MKQTHRHRYARCTKHGRFFAQPRRDKVTCAACSVTRDASMLDSRRLRGLMEQGNTHEAVCLRCRPEHLPDDGTHTSTCTICEGLQAVDAYSLPMQKKIQKRDYKDLKCLSCQYLRCIACTERPAQLLNSLVAPKNKHEVEAFRCQSCATTPNQICGDPASRKQRRMHKHNVWTCAKCVKNTSV